MLIKVIHNLQEIDRQTTKDFALSFARYSYGCEVEYSNINFLHQKTGNSRPDLCVITYELMSIRTTAYWGEIQPLILQELENCPNVMIFVQDDYAACSITEEFILKISNFASVQLFTPVKNHLSKLYPKLIDLIKIRYCHTGYVEESHLPRIQSFYKNFEDRRIDYGNRVNSLPIWLGEQATKKFEISKVVATEFTKHSARVSNSGAASEVMNGLDWFRFLGDTRFTAGCLGGSSISDPVLGLATRAKKLETIKGSLNREDLRFLLREENQIGDFSTIGPRVFEAAMMGTCQILEEAEYLLGFKAGTHFLPITLKDKNSISKIVKFVLGNLEYADEISKNARVELIESQKWSYSTFVREIGAVAGNATSKPKLAVSSAEFFDVKTNVKWSERKPPIDYHSGTDASKMKIRSTMLSKIIQPCQIRESVERIY